MFTWHGGSRLCTGLLTSSQLYQSRWFHLTRSVKVLQVRSGTAKGHSHTLHVHPYKKLDTKTTMNKGQK